MRNHAIESGPNSWANIWANSPKVCLTVVGVGTHPHWRHLHPQAGAETAGQTLGAPAQAHAYPQLVADLTKQMEEDGTSKADKAAPSPVSWV